VYKEGMLMVDDVVRCATIEVANVVEELSVSAEGDATTEVRKDIGGGGEVLIVACCARESGVRVARYSNAVKWSFLHVVGIVLAAANAWRGPKQCGAEGVGRFGMGRSGRGQVEVARLRADQRIMAKG
jgi:hypothetical protein